MTTHLRWKKRLRMIPLALYVAALAGMSVNPGIFASVAHGQAPVCDPWADAVEDLEQGTRKNGSPVLPARSDPDEALGPNNGTGFVSLGLDGQLVLSFDNYILNGTGADVRVYEVTGGTSPREEARVFASQDGSGWTLIGTATNTGTNTFDLGALPWARYIGFDEDTDPAPHANTEDGFDLDAVEALHSTCTQPGGSSASSSVQSSSTMSGTGASSSIMNSSSTSSVVCDPWADSVALFNQGDRKDNSAVLASRSNPNQALGPNNGTGFVSLGFDGQLAVRFTNFILNGTGADVRVYEVTGGTFPLERARVYASQNGSNWTQIGTATSTGTNTFDLGSLAWARYIGLVDFTNPALHTADADGIDIDAVEALHSTCLQPGNSSASSLASSVQSSSTMTSASASSIVCDPWADSVAQFQQKQRQDGSAVLAARSNPNTALGAASASGFVSLGFDGQMILGFTNFILNGTGADVRVYEVTDGSYPAEVADIFASQNGSNWVKIGTATNSGTNTFDLGALPWARYIGIDDDSQTTLHPADSDAFDVNAVEALHSSCTQPGNTSSVSSSQNNQSSQNNSSQNSSTTSGGVGQVPRCDGKTATVYVNAQNRIVGGPLSGRSYRGWLIGTNGDDVIVGTQDDDRLYGSAGDDTICGGDGDDWIIGGSGNDRIGAEAGDDEARGGSGEDLLCGHGDDDELAGNAQNDQLDGGDGSDDDLDGGAGSDVCRNGEDNDDCEQAGSAPLAACAALISSF